MLSSHIWMAFLGLAFGIAVSAGTFAFIIAVGVVPRMVGKSNTGKYTILYENFIWLGGTIGCILSVFLTIRIPIGSIFLVVYGICAGIFVGCLAVALAEILNTFPITFRRLGIKHGLKYVMFFMALGKMCGAFYYFWNGMAAP